MDGRSPVWQGACECVTCGKDMLICWDTVCKDCESTSCYAHSWLVGPEQVVGGFRVKDAAPAYWYCAACAKKYPDATQRHLGTPEEEAEKERITQECLARMKKR